jgi:adenylate kinase
MKIVLIGAQGAGKGVQGRILSKELGIEVYSAGDLLRSEAEKDTKEGKNIKVTIDTGKLVSHEVIFNLFKKYAKKDFIFDGFPRTIEQVKLFESEWKVNHVIYIDISERVSIERLSGRAQCKKCGKIYGISKELKPKKEGKCDECDVELYIREDDKPDAIKRRLNVFNKQTKPVVDYFEKKGVLRRIDGEKSVDEVAEEIRNIFKHMN